MTQSLTLVAFALPPTFPPEFMPDAGKQFVDTCAPGKSRTWLMRRARELGWAPTWKPLPQFDRDGIEAFGFGLTIDGMVVPLIARMQRVARRASLPRVIDGSRVPECDPRQMSLF